MSKTELLFEIIGGVGFVANVIGNLMLARMHAGGWWVRLLSNVLWTIYACTATLSIPLLLNHATFFGINIYGLVAWRRKHAARA